MIDPDDELTRRTARADAAIVPDEATVLSARRSPAADEAEDVDDHTALAPRRVAAPAVSDDFDATSIAGRRPVPEPFPGTSAPSDTRTAGGTTIEERTDETLLRSVRRAPQAEPPAVPDSSSAVAGRAAYLPGEEASDRRSPRSSVPVIASRTPVVPPSSVTPAPAPVDAPSRRRRHRRRLLTAGVVAVAVVVAAVVALILLLT